MGAHILVVDDEVQIGRCLGRILADHDVEHVCTGAQALMKLIAGRRYDLIFVDVGLDDMSGAALVESVSRIAPAAKPSIVFITGGDVAAITAQFPRHKVLPKPFDLAAVRSLVPAVRKRVA